MKKILLGCIMSIMLTGIFGIGGNIVEASQTDMHISNRVKSSDRLFFDSGIYVNSNIVLMNLKKQPVNSYLIAGEFHFDGTGVSNLEVPNILSTDGNLSIIQKTTPVSAKNGIILIYMDQNTGTLLDYSIVAA